MWPGAMPPPPSKSKLKLDAHSFHLQGGSGGVQRAAEDLMGVSGGLRWALGGLKGVSAFLTELQSCFRELQRV